jgi:hypothetical protein
MALDDNAESFILFAMKVELACLHPVQQVVYQPTPKCTWPGTAAFSSSVALQGNLCACFQPKCVPSV